MMRRLSDGGIVLRTGERAVAVVDGALSLQDAEPLGSTCDRLAPADRTVRPRPAPRRRRLRPVDDYGRVPDRDGVWAVGDMTTRPLKQGGLAAQQADVAAASIAARAGEAIEVAPYRPVLRGLLLTCEEPEFLEERRGVPLRTRRRSSRGLRRKSWRPPPGALPRVARRAAATGRPGVTHPETTRLDRLKPAFDALRTEHSRRRW
jgi:sulfide:quinone oxidoreductase